MYVTIYFTSLQDFTDAVPGCDTKVRRAFENMNSLAKQGPTGEQQLPTILMFKFFCK